MSLPPLPLLSSSGVAWSAVAPRRYAWRRPTRCAAQGSLRPDRAPLPGHYQPVLRDGQVAAIVSSSGIQAGQLTLASSL